jgi:putative flippase GtrA
LSNGKKAVNDSPTNREQHPQHPPVVPIPQDPFLPTRRLQRLVNLFPPGQFARYLAVGAFNTLFGYGSFVVALTLLDHALPVRWLSLTVVLASVISTPLNITVAYLGYKLFVFRTHGNYLMEWLKCFAVYGTGMLPGLLLLSALTRLLQTEIHRHAPALRGVLSGVESHLSGTPLTALQRVATGKAMAGYIAGAVVIGLSTVYSFVGHKKVTFRKRKATAAA